MRDDVCLRNLNIEAEFYSNLYRTVSTKPTSYNNMFLLVTSKNILLLLSWNS